MPPENPFEALSPRFEAVTGSHPILVKVVAVDAHEGPVYAADEDALYFSTLPRPAPEPGAAPDVAIKRLALDGDRLPLEPDRVTTVAASTRGANGMVLSRDGSLLVCEQGSRDAPARIGRFDRAARTVTTVVDACRGRRFNSPNDVVETSDGSIWFTDPSYGHLQGFKDAPEVGDFVYRHDAASSTTRVVADGFDKPNGLAFSPDESVLYVTDSGANQEAGSFHPHRPHHVLAFDVLDVHDGQLRNQRVFAVTAPGFPDGIKVDREGRVYLSSPAGVLVHDAGGDLIGEIRVPGTVNFTFGGPAGNVLFVTNDTAVWAAVLDTTAPHGLRERG